MYTVLTHKRVDKFLEKHRNVAKKFVKYLSQIEKTPYLKDKNIKKLEGQDGEHYRLRMGKYRLLYEVIDDKILIYFYDAGSR